MKRKVTQAQRVVDYLERFGSITSAEAFIELSIMDLPKRICELKDMGYVFNIKTVIGKNKFGDTVHWNVYSFATENDDAKIYN